MADQRHHAGDAVESLAQRIGFSLTYEDGGQSGEEAANRVRLLEANRLAAEFFVSQLPTAAAVPGQHFLTERGFDEQAAARFGVGWAPKSWDAVTKHLRGHGFSDQELSTAGLVSSGDRGVYDRFRGRLTWPIRDLTGAVVGGVSIGIIQAMNEGGAYGLGSNWSQSVVFLILIVLMVFKPEGIFGRPTTEKV